MAAPHPIPLTQPAFFLKQPPRRTTHYSFPPHSQWSKHGTCANPPFTSQLAFFNGTLALRSKYDAIPALAAAGITPSNTKTFTIQELRSALTTAYGQTAVVSCDSQGRILGLTYCISKGLEIMECPSATSDDCSSSTLTLPDQQTMTSFRGPAEEAEEGEGEQEKATRPALRG